MGEVLAVPAELPVFLGKAGTLDAVRPLLRTAAVLPSHVLERSRWRASRERCLDACLAEAWAGDPMIVRSSATVEDRSDDSSAGRLHSELSVTGRDALAGAVDRVFDSYDAAGLHDPQEQVLVQPMITDAVASGVAMSRDHSSGGPYRVLSWVEGPATTVVTGGQPGPFHTWYVAAGSDPGDLDALVRPVLDLVEEVERLFDADVEIEFGLSRSRGLVLFQVRPLAGLTARPRDARALLTPVARRVAAALARHHGRDGRPQVAAGEVSAGGPTVLGVMPDWNPAEVVGTRPRRLALSLYQRLVTSDSWSRARARYGYHDLTGVPLLVDLGGLPYVDVRASAASLVPATVPLPVTRRVVDRYVQALVDHPTLHDKIEFEVVLSAWGPATPEWIGDRFTDVLQPAELEAFAGALRALTNDVVIGSCPWRDDLAALSGLAHGRERARRHPAGSPSRIADLLDSARVSGVVPFAGLARAAFIATQILDQGVRVGALDPGDRDAVLGQAESVTGAFLLAARNSTDDDSFLARYGHLRPGTYDVLSPRYDEHGGRYFLPLAGPGGPAPDGISVRGTAPATPTVMRRLDAVLSGCGCAFDAAAFCDFTARVVHGRELAKLEFTRNLSDALSEIVVWAERRGLSRTEVAHLRIEDLLDGGGRGDHDESEQGPGLRGLVTEGREEHDTATAVVLPPLLRRPADVWSFRQPPATPNFITRHRVLAGVADVDGGQDPRGRVALIASADPGYDWIFARGAVGVVTAFGGVNSHMAVRARELGVPTATGVGEDRFRRLLTVRAVELDAGAGVLRGIR